MSIRIDQSACVGCGRCAEVCPGNLIRLNAAARAEIRIPEDCWGCTSCLKECPTGAVRFFLGADIGGRGSTLRVKCRNGISHWEIVRPDGTIWRIDVNQKEANRY